jgi:phosphate transport system permease protein
MMKLWFKSGSPWIWLNAAAVSTCLIMVIAVLGLVLVRGTGNFWPAQVTLFSYQEEGKALSTIIGEKVDTSITPAIMAKSTGHKMADNEDTLVQYLVKTGNRDVTGADFRWIEERNVKEKSDPENLIVIERREWGNFYGQPFEVKENGKTVATGEQVMPELQTRLEAALVIFKKINQIEKKEIGAINYGLERLRLKQKKLQLENRWDSEAEKQFAADKADFDAQYQGHQAELASLYKEIRRDTLITKTESGAEIKIPLAKIVKVYQPNQMSIVGKFGFFFHKVYEFLTDDPREANTEGGIFPAIFGTVMMVIIMSIIVTPFGVIAAVYLREYAKQGFITQLIRIAVNNLAGVPSIVYGVFGLGFFVYILGGNIDALFFPESAPAPVYGTPGLLWASLTLALLTLPVVIVSTEEGLARIPKAIREGSLALGATKIETLWRTVLPMASPAMMTGLILAVARAAGEVAPLMLVGVVKLAPTLPLDGNFPFLHLDRKFMHLGFHIYDVGFQSPNVEAARPLVYATALLLVLVIVVLNLTAIIIRNRLREKYRALEG